MKYEKKTSGLSLKDILWKLLLSWKFILLCAVICCALTFVYVRIRRPADDAEYRKAKTEYDNQVNLANTMNQADKATQMEYSKGMVDAWRAELTAEQADQVDNLMSIRELIDSTQRQLNESIVMKVDPYSIPTLTVIYEIQPEVPENLSLIVTAYNTANTAGRYRYELESKMGWTNLDDFDPYADILTFAFINGNQFNITVIYDDENELETISNALNDVLQGISGDISVKTASHQLHLVDKVIARKTNTTYASTKNTYQQWITSYINQINSVKNGFNDTQKRLFTYYSAVMDGNEDGYTEIDISELKEPSGLQSIKIRTVVGFLTGIVLGALIVLLMMLFGGKLQTAEELAEVFDLPLTGSLLGYKRGFIIDELIKRAKIGNDGQYDPDSRINIAAIKIAEQCRKKDRDRIVIATTDNSAFTMEVIARLTDSLKKKGIKVSCSGNIQGNAEILQNALDAGICVIAERLYKSSYANIEKEILLADGSGIGIIGALSVE